MSVVINFNGVIEDDWIELDDHANLENSQFVILTASRIIREWDVLKNLDCNFGVIFAVTDDVEDLIGILDRLKMIILKFDAFSDGRAFSQAKLLRERLGYKGEIRADGEVLRDQLSFMQRCGFTQFRLAEHEEVDLALNAFCDISYSYQPESYRIASC